MLGSLFLTEVWRPLPLKSTAFSLPFVSIRKFSRTDSGCGCKFPKTRNFHHGRRIQLVNCSDNGDQSTSLDDSEQGPPQEAVLKAISGIFLLYVIRKQLGFLYFTIKNALNFICSFA